jgi:regulator of protease activity HflC (stomatin/prohibitin superfamily)
MSATISAMRAGPFNMPPAPTKRSLTMFVFFAVAILLMWTSYFTVSETNRGVLTTWGKFSEVKGPGLHFKVPFMQSVTAFRVDIQSFSEDKVNTYTIDNQELEAHFTVNYRVPALKVENVFKNIPDYSARLHSLAIDRFKAEVGHVNVTEIAQKRGAVRDAIFKNLKIDADRLFGIDIVDFQITNVDFNRSFREANNSASTAKARVEQAEQEKRQAVVDAERAKIKATGEANAAEEQARGAANAVVLNAEAEAKAIRLKGEAQASAIKSQSDALASNPLLIELRKAERWNGELPKQMLSNVVPFMNVDQAAKLPGTTGK